jgi:hypothetical protein
MAAAVNSADRQRWHSNLDWEEEQSEAVCKS